MEQADIEAVEEARAERLRALSGHLAATVRLSRAMAESGRRIDLSGLESSIGLLCAQALDLPPARTLAPLLAALVA